MKSRTRTPDPQPYHHGNLRQALLAEALASLRTEGAENLSLRALARALGVSQAAPYRHFADKESLLAELAAQGFRELGDGMRVAMESPHLPPAAAMQASGVSYIRFATRHPELYRLMFGTCRVDRTRYAGLDEAAADAFSALLAAIQRGVDSGNFRDEPVMVMAMAAWSIVHGFASLAIDGQLSAAGVTDDCALAEQVTRLLRVGVEIEREARPPQR